MKPTSTENGASLPPPKTGRTVLALFRTGGRRCRLVAAFVAVMVGLAGQTATQALAQSKETVLYLDAPAVSTDRATRAGETAAAYSDPRSPASSSALAWLGVAGSQGAETEALPRDAAGALASVSAPDAEGTPGITAEAAYDAGETMLAQIEDGAPSEDGRPGDEELAATDAVRPELGYGTQAQDEEPSAGYEAPPAEQPAIGDPASSPEPVVPASAPLAEPSGGEGLALEAPASAPAPTELAAVPTDDASPVPGISLDTEPNYDATGPISEPAAEPATTAESSTEPEVQEQEVQEPEVQEPEVQEPASPSGGDEAAVLETPDGPGPGASPAASGEASASPEPAVEPSAVPIAGADATPAASPRPTDEAAYDAQAPGPEPADERDYEEPTAAPDTGPTSDQGGDVALAPTSSPPPGDDGGLDDLASASSTPELSGREDALENVSEEQTSEVVVQESDTSEGADPAASPPPDFAPSTDETEDEGPEGTGPPPWTPPSDEEADPYPAPLAEQSTAEGAGGALASASPAPGEDERKDGSKAEISEEQISEVVVVQEYDTGEGADPTAAQPPRSALPGDEVEDETHPEPASPAEQPTDAGTEEDVPPLKFSDEQPPGQTDPGSGETATPPPADGTQGPAPDTPYGAGSNDEGTADGPSGCGDLLHAPEDTNCNGVPDSPPSEEAPPGNGGQNTPQDPVTGEASGEGPASTGEPPSGDQQAPPGAAEQGPALGGDPGADEPRPETDDPADGGSDQRPDRPRGDRKETRPDRGDRRDRGRYGTTSPDERLQRIRVGDGGGNAVQEKARERTGRPSSGDLGFDSEQRPATEFQDGGPSGGGRVPELPASIAPRISRGDDAATRRESAQDVPQNVVQGPALDLYGASLGHSGVAGRAGKELTFREQRSRGADAANPEDAEEKASEGSQAENYPVRTVDLVREGAGNRGDQADSAGVEEPAPDTTSPGRSPETRFERMPERRTAGAPAQERSDTGPAASQPAVDETPVTPQTRSMDGEVRTRRTPPMWDRLDVPPGRPQSTEAPDPVRALRPPADRATPNPRPSPDSA